MWPFRRRKPAPPAPVRARRATRPADWPALPPVQRVVSDPPVVVGTSGFEADLRTWQAPTFLAPLRHQVSAEAPTGSADLARPVPVSRASEFPLLLPPPKRPVQRVTSAVTTQSNPTLISAPPVTHQPRELLALPDPPAGLAEPTAEVAAPVLADDEPAVTEAPTLGVGPDAPGPTADEPGAQTAAVALTAERPIHGWRPQPGGVGLPLREVPGAVQRSTSYPTSTAAPVYRDATPPTPAGQPPAAPTPTPAGQRPTEPTPGQPAPNSSPPAQPRPGLPLAQRKPDRSEPAAPGDPSDAVTAPLMGDRPLQRQATDDTDEPPVQLSRLGEQAPWIESAQLPSIGASPFAPAFAPASRPLLGAAPLLAPGSAPDLPGLPPSGATGRAPEAIAGASAVQRGTGSATTMPAAAPLRPGVSVAAAPPAVQLMRTLPADSYRAPVTPGSAPTSGPARGAAGNAPSAVLPPVRRSAAAAIPDPAAAAISAGVASRDADGSVVFRSFLDDAVSSGKQAASSAASDALSSAKSKATDAASSALSSASDRAHGAVSDAAAKVASVAGLPAPAAGGGVATGDLDDLARKLYDRLRFRLTTELRLDRERSGCVTDLPR